MLLKIQYFGFQTVYANVIQYSGQNAVKNIEHKLPFPYKNAGANGIPAANQIARNAAATDNILTNAGASNTNANIGNPNIANANLNNPSNANANRVNVIMENLNPSAPNQINTSQENANWATPKFADIKLAAQNLANSLANNNFARNSANFGYGLSNSNLINNNNRPNLANQLYRPNFAKPLSQTNLASPLLSDTANAYKTNTFKPYTNSFNMGNLNAGISNYLTNVSNGKLASGNIASGNIASGSIANGNLASGNIANGNIAQALTTGNLANTIVPGATFAIGGNPFKVLNGLPGSQIGLNIIADALEVEGSVTVAGKMPFYSTVALSGILPADGTATVSYGCSKQNIF